MKHLSFRHVQRAVFLFTLLIVNLAVVVQLVNAATFTGSISLSDPTQTGRIIRNGIPSSCTSSKTFPGMNDTAIVRHYRQYSITNTSGASKCVNVNISTSCGPSAFVLAYRGSFNPASPGSNYLADAGTSESNTAFSFNLAAGETAVIVVHEVNANVGCGSYTLTTSPDFTGSDNPVKWFNPDDDRVQPLPGDRLAVWCNQPDKIVVYGIASDQPGDKSGFFLTVFSYKEVVAAGDKGLTKHLGSNGSVSISLMKGWFWIAWNGGKYNATGQGIFVKNFEDAAWCLRAH